MTNIVGRQNLNAVQIVETDGPPNSGGGLNAPIGSVALDNSGSGLYVKKDVGPTGWHLSSTGTGGGTVNPIGSSLQNRLTQFADNDGYQLTGSNLFQDGYAIGLGTVLPNELLTIAGRLALAESTTPTASAGYGKLYPKADGYIYYLNDGGIEYNLTQGSGGGGGSTSPGGSSGQVQYNNSGSFAGSAALAFDNGAGSLALAKNQNNLTYISVGNSTSGANAASAIYLTSQNNIAFVQAISDAYSRTSSGFHPGSVQLYSGATNGLNIISGLGSGSAGAGTGLIRFITGTADLTGTTSGNDANTRMVIDATGNVGVGTTIPDSLITAVANRNSDTVISVSNTTNGSNADAAFSATSQNNYIQVISLSDSYSRGYAGFHSGSSLIFGGSTRGLNIISGLGSGSAGADTGKIRFITSNASIVGSTPGNDANTRMIILADGSVGIGTLAPSSQLHVGGSGGVAINSKDTSNTGDSYVLARNDSDNYVAFHTYGTSASGNIASSGVAKANVGSIEWGAGIGAAVFRNSANAPMIFLNNDLEKMRLAADGKLGLGVISPSCLLDARGSDSGAIELSGQNTNSAGQTYLTAYNDTRGTAYISIETTGSTASGNFGGGLAGSSLALANSARVEWGASTSVALLRNVANTAMVFVNNDTEYMRLTASGRLGIGTITPSENLSVIAPSNATNQIAFGISGQGKSAFYRDDTTGLSIYSALTSGANKDIHIATGGAGTDERMTILGTGNIGIGTTTPVGSLDITISQNTETALYVSNSNTGGAAVATVLVGQTVGSGNYGYISHSGTGYTTDGLYVADRTIISGQDTAGLLILAHAGSAPLIFATGGHAAGNERLRIDSTGNVGIGVISPTSLLHAGGSVAFPTVTVTNSDTTLDSTNYSVRMSTGSSNRTVNLPATAGCVGRIYVVKKVDAGAGTVTVDGNASETIDGSTTFIISTQYNSVTIQSNGTGWDIL